MSVQAQAIKALSGEARSKPPRRWSTIDGNGRIVYKVGSHEALKRSRSRWHILTVRDTAKLDCPPEHPGEWADLSKEDRSHWLSAALERHRVAAEDGTRAPDKPPGAVFVVDARQAVDLEGLLCAVGEAINGPGGYFGLSLLALDDCLFGGFGATRPFTLKVCDASNCRAALGCRALASWAEQELQECQSDDDAFYDPEWLELLRRRADSGELTLFDLFVDTVVGRGVSVTDENGNAFASSNAYDAD